MSTITPEIRRGPTRAHEHSFGGRQMALGTYRRWRIGSIGRSLAHTGGVNNYYHNVKVDKHDSGIHIVVQHNEDGQPSKTVTVDLGTGYLPTVRAEVTQHDSSGELPHRSMGEGSIFLRELVDELQFALDATKLQPDAYVTTTGD